MSYNPTLGRWIGRDPAGYVDGLNLYQYVRDDPIGLTDPMGLDAAKPPTFKGFEDNRFQEHDDLIARVVDDFNRNREKYCGCTDKQKEKVSDLDPALVKSWIIQETGGSDKRSLAAWEKDPAQVNVPGDWDPNKADVGLKKPTARNEGDLEANLKAALSWLCRKGFGKSGAPARNRPDGFFDSWEDALKRYNGRGETTDNGNPYRDNYADQITKRAGDPGNHFPIELPKPRK